MSSTELKENKLQSKTHNNEIMINNNAIFFLLFCQGKSLLAIKMMINFSVKKQQYKQ